MNHLSRRSLLALISVSAIAISGCVTTRTGTTTTRTLNVAKVEAYVTAGLTAAATVSTAFSVIPALSQYAPVLQNAVSLLTSAAAAFSSAVGDKVSISYNDANLKTIIDSVLAAIKNLVDVIYKIVINLKTLNLTADQQQTLNKVELAYDAISTILAVFQAALVSVTADAKSLKMTEGQALAALNVSHSAPLFLDAVAQ